MRVTELVTWLDSPEAGDGDVLGCRDDEIEQIRRAQGVDRLPADCRAFLALARRRARSLGVGTEMFYPWLLETKDWMTEIRTFEDWLTAEVEYVRFGRTRLSERDRGVHQYFRSEDYRTR